MSIFEENEMRGGDLDVSAQDKINTELQEFLQQIKEIRDGPQEKVQGRGGGNIIKIINNIPESSN